MTSSSMSVSSQSNGQRALLLRNKVQSIRGLVNPYQLGDQSNQGDHQRRAAIEIDTDIDDTDVDVGDDESTFTEGEAGDVKYVLGGQEELADNGGLKKKPSSTPRSPDCVTDLVDNCLVDTSLMSTSAKTTHSSRSRGSRASRKTNTSSKPSKKTKGDYDSSSTGSPSSRGSGRKKVTMAGDASERITSKEKAGKSHLTKGPRKQELGQRSSSRRKVQGRLSVGDAIANGAHIEDILGNKETRKQLAEFGRNSIGGGSALPSQKEDDIDDIDSSVGEISENEGGTRRQSLGGRSLLPQLREDDIDDIDDSVGDCFENEGATRKKGLCQRTSSRRKLGSRSSRRKLLKDDDAGDTDSSDSEGKSKDSSRLRGSQRRTLGKGSSHGDRRRLSRKGSKSSMKSGSSHDQSSVASTVKNEPASDASIGNSTPESRKDAVLKSRSKFLNQKNCKVGPINRRASRSRRSTMQGVPEAQPMVGFGHSLSGSISSITMSSGLGSKDDFSLPSPGMLSIKKAVTISPASGHERRAAGLSRWGKSSTCSDGVPARPGHALSPAAPSSKPGVQGSVEATSASPLGRSQTTPGSHSRHSKFSNSILSNSTPLSLEDKKLHGMSKNKFYPEILVPATPSRSPGTAVSGLTTPGTNDGSQKNSLDPKLGVCFKIGENTPGGFVSEVTTTPCIKRNALSQQLQRLDAPVTPAMSIGVNEMDTPGGRVSELTNSFSSLMSFDSYSNEGGWMTNVQSVMIHESDYNKDAAPRMVRRHSLDSISYVDEGAEEEDEDACEAKENDNAPRAPTRKMSLSSAPKAPTRQMSISSFAPEVLS